jgi:hypothetical protein
MDIEALRRTYTEDYRVPGGPDTDALASAMPDIRQKIEAMLQRIVDLGGDPRDYSVGFQKAGEMLYLRLERTRL